MKSALTLVVTFLTLAAVSPLHAQRQTVDILLLGGRVLDGAGNPWVRADVGVTGERIAFVGLAGLEDVAATDTIDATGLVITPGFWDMHSHAELEEDWGRAAANFLYQGITSVVIGLDGGGTNEIDRAFAGYEAAGIGVNALRFVGHGAARRAVMGLEDRAPTPAEMDALKTYVRQGMEQGAMGLSSGLFYIPNPL